VTALASALAYSSVLLLALGMRGHHRTVFGRECDARRRRLWVSAGYMILALALVPAVAGHGWAGGLVAWLGAVTVGGFSLTLLLAIAPRWVAAPAVVLLGAVFCFPT